MIVVGVDFGSVRIGLARSDEARSIAFPFTSVPRGKSDGEGVAACLRALEGVEVESFVVGLPLTLAGEEGQSAKRARRFGELLAEESGRPVRFMDERLSSAAASRNLRAMGMDERAQRGKLDERAAALILETYLGTLREVTWDEQATEPDEDEGRAPRTRGRRGRSRR